MNRRTRTILANARDPYADDLLDEEAERRHDNAHEPLTGPECDRRADLDAMKRGAW